jgi:hypothetical protein
MGGTAVLSIGVLAAALAGTVRVLPLLIFASLYLRFVERFDRSLSPNTQPSSTSQILLGNCEISLPMFLFSHRSVSTL